MHALAEAQEIIAIARCRREYRPLASLLVTLLISVLALAACDAGGSTIRIISPTGTVEIVPGSRGIGNPAGAVDIRYVLGGRADVHASLEGPVNAPLFEGEQSAGQHVLRFNGVIEGVTKEPGGAVRSVVPDGNYKIVLSAAGSSEEVEVTVRDSDVERPSIESLVLQPSAISPNSDAVDDVAELTFRTDQTSTLSVDLTAADGVVTRVLAPDERAGGEQNVVVNGQTPAGEVLPDGTYTITVRAQDRAGNRVEAYRPFVIEGAGEPQIVVMRVQIGPGHIILGKSLQGTNTVYTTGNGPPCTHCPETSNSITP